MNNIENNRRTETRIDEDGLWHGRVVEDDPDEWLSGVKVIGRTYSGSYDQCSAARLAESDAAVTDRYKANKDWHPFDTDTCG